MAESVVGRVAVMVAVGTVGGLLAIQLLRSEASPRTLTTPSPPLSSLAQAGQDADETSTVTNTASEVTATAEDVAKRTSGNVEIERDFLRKLVVALKTLSTEKTDAVQWEARANRVARSISNTLEEQMPSPVYTNRHRIRHPEKKLHHRRYDELFPGVKQKEEAEKTEEEKKANNDDEKARENKNDAPKLHESHDSHDDIPKRTAEVTPPRDTNITVAFRASGNPSKTLPLVSMDVRDALLLALSIALLLAVLVLLNLYCCCCCCCCWRRREEEEEGLPYCPLKATDVEAGEGCQG